MDFINIKGVILTPLKRISNPLGDILHGLKESDVGFSGFGEAYFTTIKGNQIKGWNRHKKMTMNLIVPIGKAIFVLYDDRDKTKIRGNLFKIELSSDNYKRLTIPPGIWVAFKGKSDDANLILNVANMEHDPDEVEKLELNQIRFNWNSL